MGMAANPGTNLDRDTLGLGLGPRHGRGTGQVQVQVCLKSDSLPFKVSCRWH
jgi:hypothetical protein